MALTDLTGKNIQDTFQKVVQTDGTNLADGTGSALPISFRGNDVVISGSLIAQTYVVSESIVNISSGSTVFGDSGDDSHFFSGSITASGNISSSGDVYASNLILPPDGEIAPSENHGTIKFMTKKPGTTNNGEMLTIGQDLIEFKASPLQVSPLQSYLKLQPVDGGQDIITFNADQNDIDFQINSIDTIAIKFIASSSIGTGMSAFRDHVGIGYSGDKWPTHNYSVSGTPDKQLMVAGLTHLTGSVEIIGPITTNITASGNISSSGTGSFEHIQLPGGGTIQFDDTVGSNDQWIIGNDNNITVDGDAKVKLIANDTIEVGIATNDIKLTIDTSEGHITASGNISSSGEIIGTINGGNF